MLRKRNTKIIATLGSFVLFTFKNSFYISWPEQIYSGLILVMAHMMIIEKQFFILDNMKNVLGRPIAILGDLQGPKIRIGNFKKSQEFLKNNQKFTLDLNNLPGDENRVFLPHPEIFKSVKKNNKILIDDGKISTKYRKSFSNQIKQK